MKLAKVSFYKVATRLGAVLLLFFLCLNAFAKKPQYPERPEPNHLLNDYVGVLTDGEASRLERKLTRFDNNTSTQICMVVMNSISGADVGQYAAELGERWGIGQTDKDNGIVVLVLIKERKMFIATGSGTEQYLTDDLCGEIINDVMKPEFKKGDYYTGLDKAADEMINILDGAFENTTTAGYSSSSSNTTPNTAYQTQPAIASTTATKANSSSSSWGFGTVLLLVFLVILLVVVIGSSGSANKGRITYASSGSYGPSRFYGSGYTTRTAVSSYTSRRFLGGGNSSSSGSSSSSSSSSRNTNFGGGKFNGGGSGGSW